jgi:hypothetical protein
LLVRVRCTLKPPMIWRVESLSLAQAAAIAQSLSSCA